MQISLALAEIHLLLYAKCWDEGVRDHTQILIFEHLCMCVCLSVDRSCHSMYMAVRIQHGVGPPTQSRCLFTVGYVRPAGLCVSDDPPAVRTVGKLELHRHILLHQALTYGLGI